MGDEREVRAIAGRAEGVFWAPDEAGRTWKRRLPCRLGDKGG
jgi:hypothetical protein